MGLTVRQETAVFRGASPEITAAIKTASEESGVSFSYLMTKASTESGFRADAKASSSSATGLYQFIDKTWLGMVRDHGDKIGLDRFADALELGQADKQMRKEILDLRKDPKTAALMAAQYACDNKQHLEKTVGGKVGDTELYLAHFLGPSGAEKFLKAYRADPNRPGVSVCPSAAEANRSIFYDKSGSARSLRDIYNRFSAKFDECRVPEPATAFTNRGSLFPATQIAGGPSAAISSGAATAAIPSRNVLSPTAYAAKIFMAGLSMPGDKAGSPL